MVHTTILARFGSLSGGRSTIAEKVLRLRGIIFSASLAAGENPLRNDPGAAPADGQAYRPTP